jgi:hypothetical protein
MRSSTLIYFAIGSAILQFASSTDVVAQEKWAAIIGSSDRSSVGWSVNQPSRAKAIAAAKQSCRAHARTDNSCDSLRKAWKGPKCEPVFVRGQRRSVCNQ